MSTTPPLVERSVRLIELQPRESLATALDRDPESRRLCVVSMTDEAGNVGWGECAALNRPGYTSEWADDSYERLAIWAEHGATPARAEHPMASAAVEMALLDLVLGRAEIALADHLGVTARRVPAGAAVGLADVATGVATVARLADEGYRRVKVKAAPDALSLPSVLAHEFPDVDIHVDANGSLDRSHHDTVGSWVDAGVSLIEQPHPVDHPEWAAELRGRLDGSARVAADEGVRSIADARSLLDARAVDALVVKPPCLGGIAAALELVAWARENGVAALAGGMLESGLGRHALAAVAGLDGMTVAGDLSPAGRWYTDDPWPDLTMHDGEISVPSTPGVAPAPDVDALERITRRKIERTD